MNGTLGAGGRVRPASLFSTRCAGSWGCKESLSLTWQGCHVRIRSPIPVSTCLAVYFPPCRRYGERGVALLSPRAALLPLPPRPHLFPSLLLPLQMQTPRIGSTPRLQQKACRRRNRYLGIAPWRCMQLFPGMITQSEETDPARNKSSSFDASKHSRNLKIWCKNDFASFSPKN